MYTSREDKLKELSPDLKPFRLKQVNTALFNMNISGWNDVSTLPKDLRAAALKTIPWMSIEQVELYQSKRQDTFKAVLKTQDHKQFESVLMANRKGQWTICVSSQIGCAMRCNFCATGTLGLKRSMHSDEIADQYRYWQQFLLSKPELPQRISNIVFMGMGEPLANYDNVKAAIHTWLGYTDLGPTKIMVSTVGILTQMQKLLTDPDWPEVRIAISLHSANQTKREEIVPTTVPEFLKKLAHWSHEYERELGNRNHYITAEYTLLSGVNDTPELARELAKYIKKTAIKKINVIPYNPVSGKSFSRSDRARIEHFKPIVLDMGVNITERKIMGEDSDAACGQLALTEQKQ